MSNNIKNEILHFFRIILRNIKEILHEMKPITFFILIQFSDFLDEYSLIKIFDNIFGEIYNFCSMIYWIFFKNKIWCNIFAIINKCVPSLNHFFILALLMMYNYVRTNLCFFFHYMEISKKMGFIYNFEMFFSRFIYNTYLESLIPSVLT